ncbi:erythroid differentiation-related factor 1 isoform X2 [Oratosquilla oratoria]|uniref:erythroid differentiation-related factor 1 isoform X2 n=1 Tax=Oratosquilla oratoria TaxID=337810 RepID=UPI003F76C0B4
MLEYDEDEMLLTLEKSMEKRSMKFSNTAKSSEPGEADAASQDLVEENKRTMESFPISDIKSEEMESSSDDSEIHSFTVIKSTQVEFPVQFHELQCNTDLKLPPSNWLQEHTMAKIPNISQRRADFSSFLMAHEFPDCIGEVDVVSDAELIKKLLKIPYNPKAHVSMMIHRIGKTLLIDDFDIYKYLLRQSEMEWLWLRKFFFEHVLQSFAQKERVLIRPNKSRDMVQSRSLLSKFLYHSICQQDGKSETEAQPRNSSMSMRRPSIMVSEVPEPTLEDQLPQSSGQAFTRNILWTFEDLRMLIGTDLPIFGGGTHPCVSLRLRDTNKPINILTGIDYWLDNLMCNVPEVLMCYHLNGIVQKYELLKTEDLPHMEDSPFSPRLIRDVAQNILSFLKNKATKEGHTYWLFKGKDDDIVKLYDLTSLCSEGGITVDGSEELPENGEGNPFTVPVGMLFYRVAKNMKASEEAHSKQATIRALLKNSLSLLDKHKYPQIVSSAHYLLSDLYMPQDIDPESPHVSDCSDEESEWSSVASSDNEDSDSEGKSEVDAVASASGSSSSTIKVSSLCLPYRNRTRSESYRPPPLQFSIEERCKVALEHVVAALEVLQHSNNTDQSSVPGSSSTGRNSPVKSKEQVGPKMAKPFQPIPMPYSPLKKENKNEDPVSTVQQSFGQEPQLTVSMFNQQYSVSSWSDKLSVLLLRKAALVYLVMAYNTFRNNKYGLSLRYIRFCLHSWYGMIRLLGLNDNELPVPSQTLSLAGDIYYMLVKAWSEITIHIEDYNMEAESQKEMLQLLESILPAQECSWLIKVPCDIEEALVLSSKVYQQALDLSGASVNTNLCKRLGNVYNELGVNYMNQASKLCNEAGVDMCGVEELWKQSATTLQNGIELFTTIGDIVNVSLLHSNWGRLLRLCAFYTVPKGSRGEFKGQERHYYNQAVKAYHKALEVIKSRKKNPEVWDLVVWEFCTTLYTIGTLLQDNPPLSQQGQEEIDREVIEVLSKALKHCDVKTPSPRQPLYQYRAAVIHMRLAGLYHNMYRLRQGDARNMRHLAELNYSKAAQQFMQLENPVDILKVQLDQAVLVQDQMQGILNQNAVAKLHCSILNLLIECQPALQIIVKPKIETCTQDAQNANISDKAVKSNLEKDITECQSNEKDEAGEVSSKDEEEMQAKLQALLGVFEKKLQTSLKALIKYQSGVKTPKKGSTNTQENELHTLKQMYSVSLNTRDLPLASHLLAAVTIIGTLLPHLSLKK